MIDLPLKGKVCTVLHSLIGSIQLSLLYQGYHIKKHYSSV